MRRMGVLTGALVIAGVLALPVSSAGAADLTNVQVRLQPVAAGFAKPVAMAWRAGDPTIYVAEQGGRVRTIVNGRRGKNVLTLRVGRASERGLLGMTFNANGTKIVVDYTDRNGDIQVDEYTMKNSNKAVKKTRRAIFFQEHSQFSNHNGGQVIYGPDGMLYISIGDGGSGGDPFGNAQRLNTLLGKIIRINPAAPTIYLPYSIPSNNPFVGTPGAKTEIWMYGLRNPWRFTFDRLTGDLWIGDVGQGAWEEIDFAPAGQSGINWGWNKREGAHPFSGTAPPGVRDPILERSHANGDCAITGGYVYRGNAIPLLNGAYVYGDYCTGQLFAAVQSGGVITQSRALGKVVPQLTSFAQAPNGDLYAISGTGGIYKLVL